MILPKIPVTSLYQQQFSNQIAKDRIMDENLHNQLTIMNTANEVNQNFNYRRNTILPTSMASLHPFSTKAASFGHTKLSTQMQKTIDDSMYCKPEHLRKLGGSPSHQEMI